LRVPAGEPTGPYQPSDPGLSAAVPLLPPKSSGSARFTPGQVLAGRYRIISQLGKGGMGEVYRADDLRLGQSVALKFLPEKWTSDPQRRAALHEEVRLAREISHPHVCRVHDIAEADGQLFLSMEFVDGENLAALLLRIGRLPPDKAVETARQLCLGLAAAHDKGVLHRDLKPANIMLDGRGRVRVTDFGLARLSERVTGDEVRSGTPAYMAPEQAAGKEVTVRSDLYALGLVLYEVFTGKKAFTGTTVEELARLKEQSSPPTPSSHVADLNPAVERVILRCLEREPQARPESALAVAMALPGSDPLAAALAAGEIPSPQMVAHAGGEGSLAPRTGLIVLGAALVGMVLAAWLSERVSLFRQGPSDKSPRELSARARSLLRQLGYADKPVDWACGLNNDHTWLARWYQPGEAPRTWEQLETGQPAILYFWYRQGPGRLAQRLTPADTTGWSMPGRVMPNEPPLREPGMACVFLDLHGRLLELHAVPPHTVTDTPALAVDWAVLLREAGLDEKQLTRLKQGQRVPPVFADAQAAWEGHYPDRPDLPVRVEAASYRGWPVYFHVGPAWQAERLYGSFVPEDGRWSLEEELYTTLGLLAIPIGGWFAWRNWRLGRANPRGATRLLACFVGLALAGWLLAAKHVPLPGHELSMFAAMLGRALVDGLLLWLAYMALEPWVRHRSPWRMIAWNRLLEGGWRDPLVGRDVLLGVLGAVVFVVLHRLLFALPDWLGMLPFLYYPWDVTYTEGAGSIFLTGQYSLLVALRDFFLFFLLLLAVRREWLAAALLVVIWLVPRLLGVEYLWFNGLAGLGFAALGLVLLFRAGLLAYIAFHFAADLLTYLPLTTDLSAWYANVSTLGLLTVAGLAVYGFWCACGRQPLFAPRAGAED